MKLTLNKVLKILVALLIIVLPFGKEHIFGVYQPFRTISVYLSDIVLVPTILIGLYSTRNVAINKVLYRFIGILALIGFISLLFSPRETYNYYSYIKWLEYLITAIFAAKIFKTAEFKDLLLKSLVASAVFQALIAGVQFVTQKSIGLRILGESVIANNIDGVAKIDLAAKKYIRAYGTFSHPNQLAAFMVVACATCVYLFFKTNTIKQQLIYGCSLLILIFAEFVSFSRIGLVVLYLTFAALFIFFYSIAKKQQEQGIELLPKLKKVFFVAVITTIAATSILFPFLKSRAELDTPPIYNRTTYNEAGLKIFDEHPIIGVGVGSVFDAMETKIAHNQDWEVQVPHNYFILTADETGLLGFFVTAAFFIHLLLALYNRAKKEGIIKRFYPYTLLCIWVGILILMQFDHYFYTLQQTQMLLWLVVGMIIAEIPVAKDLRPAN